MRNYTKIYITPKGERAARSGHPWVYADEITNIEGTYANGDLVDVVTNKGKYLGTGFINDNSKIKVRIISTNTNDKFDTAFWQRRLQYAVDYRRTVMPGDDFKCCRLIFGEADMFPGLTVDRFNDILVTQTLSLGIELRKEEIFPMLIQILRSSGENIRGIYERNDVKIRELEGMAENKGWFMHETVEDKNTVTEIVENGIRYSVDVENGQKTGFFLDQKYNRQAVARIAKGKHVLDCFTHTGAFALNAAAGGAAFVTAVDVSAEAVSMTGINAEKNGFMSDDEIDEATYPEIGSYEIPLTRKYIELVKKLNPQLPELICASGDKFISDSNFKNSLVSKFNADVCDMESAGIVLTALKNGVEVFSLKGVSDTANDEEYNSFAKRTCEVLFKVLKEILFSL